MSSQDDLGQGRPDMLADGRRTCWLLAQDQHAQAQHGLRYAQAQLMHAQAQHWLRHAQAQPYLISPRRRLSMLILATHLVAALDVTIRTQIQN